ITDDMPPRVFFADRERIQRAGLEMPAIIALREELIRLGLPVDASVQTEEELIEAICQLQ
ncbi:MAG: energy-coupling factor ABC transporter ATP-binding protein, partial [Clostridia bacterium]|nr:energy-coupling factor ABC transporter ATP-binding protein [Clostridia bacterium]